MNMDMGEEGGERTGKLALHNEIRILPHGKQNGEMLYVFCLHVANGGSIC